MSDLSVAMHAFAKATSGAINSMLDGLGLDPNTKATVQNSMQDALDGVAKVAVGAVASGAAQAASDLGANVPVDPSPAPNATTAVHAVENVLGEAVESMADAEITAVTGPLAPPAVQAANALMESVGGDIQQAIDHLFGLKTNPAPAPTASPQ